MVVEIKIQGRNHLKCMTDHVRNCWDTECYSNVTFICQKKSLGSIKTKIMANKAVLAAGSKKLHLLLSETGDENVDIIIPERDFETIKLLLQYIYTGEVLVGTLKDELESLIAEWEIGYPQITSVASNEENENTTDNPSLFSEVFTSSSMTIASHAKRIKQDPRKEKTKTTQKKNNDKPIAINESEEVKRIDVEQAIIDHVYSKTSDKKSPISNIQLNESHLILIDISTEKELFKFPDESSADDPLLINENSSELVTLDQNVGEPFFNIVDSKFRKKKIVEKNSKSDTDLLNTTASTKDSEEDGADALLSDAFFKIEKSRFEELTRNSKQLAEAIKRHEVYVKHFLGPENWIMTQTEKKVEKVLDSRIPCHLCGKEIQNRYMDDHLKSSHATERPFHCKQCGATFALPEGLRRHIIVSHPKETISHVCKFCDKTFRFMYLLRNHTTAHTGESPYECPFCDKRFRSQSSLHRHKRLHTGAKPYLCNVCGRQFSDNSNYATHLKSHNKDRTRAIPKFSCSTCGQTFHREYKLLLHEAVHTNREPILPCRRCSSTFSSLKLLREHGRDEHGDVIFSCDHCPNVYTIKRGLDEHMLLTHTIQVETFVCNECGKAFKTKTKLASHKKLVHSTERPHKCRFCPKDFKVKKLCRDHERTHTGERSYHCPHCPKAFRNCTQRNTHIRKHTGENKPFACNQCDKAFSTRANLKTHSKVHTGEKYQCPKCGECFRTKVKLNLHVCFHRKDVEYEPEKKKIRITPRILRKK